jgi:Zn-dependent M28 family amino/carboxypeptidase
MRSILWLTGLVVVAALAGGLYMFRMPGQSYSGPLSPLTPPEAEIRQRLWRHVSTLAGDIGERHLWRYEALDAAARYVHAALTRLGYEVTVQSFEVDGKTVKNLAAELPGTTRAEEIIVLGAHYDSVQDSPGANDNATGVAAVLELARLLASHSLARTVRFVAFVNEEMPFYRTDGMGSLVYARQARARAEHLVAMWSLETIGHYSDEPGSQQYPAPFGWFYPDVGNFIGFIGNLASRGLLHRSIAAFRQHTAFPSQGVAAPAWLTGIAWSDHWAFWQAGYEALMITDTAPFRYAFYHTPGDTPEKIDYDHMARVVLGLQRVVEVLAATATP